MATFFNELDMIYCLCIPERKEFVLNQINKLGIMNKIKIIDAYTENSPLVQQTIANHSVYTIYITSPVLVACTLGVREIMLDIVKNKFNYALVIEDDVIFLENMFKHGNKWITQKIISGVYDIHKPYVLYLQSARRAYNYYNRKKSDGGIILVDVQYGEPAYITNYHACLPLLKHLFPITSPFDDYKNFIKRYYKIKQGILVPYICRELSANYSKYNIKHLNQTFERTMRKKTESIFSIYAKDYFYVTTNENNSQVKMMEYLLRGINPNIKISFNNPKIPNDMMSYCLNTYQKSSGNNYILGGSFDDDAIFSDKAAFIISVRGLISQNIIKTKFNFVPLVGDILLLFNKYYPKEKKNVYQYCFIYDTPLKISCKDKYVQINTEKMDIDTLLDAITSSQYVVTDDINYITIANSYSVPGIFATIKNNLSKYHEIIAADYYSNIIDKPIKPLQINCAKNKIVIDDNFTKEISQFVHPEFPISGTTINNLVDMLPFISGFHRILQKLDKVAQIFNKS